MLVIPIEIWPKGDKDKKRLIGIIKIVNDGTGSPKKGNYTVDLCEFDVNGILHLSYEGVVDGFPRSQNAFHLLLLALTNALFNKGKIIITGEQKPEKS